MTCLVAAARLGSRDLRRFREGTALARRLAVTRTSIYKSILAVSFAVFLVGAAAGGLAIARTKSATAAPAAKADVKAVTVRADGRIAARPGAQVSVSSEIHGTVAKVHVYEGSRVKKGDVLLELKRKEHTAALQEAWAATAEANARLAARSKDAKRAKSLVASGALPAQEVEAASEAKTVARARLASANAVTVRLQAMLEQTRVLAPIDGVVVMRAIEERETVAPGTPLFTVVDLSKLRVEAEVDEFDVGRVAVGSAAIVSADGFDGQSWRGQVEEIPDVVMPRRLRPLDPSRPTDTAVLLAKVSLPEGSPLKLGQRVRLELAPVPEASIASR